MRIIFSNMLFTSIFEMCSEIERMQHVIFQFFIRSKNENFVDPVVSNKLVYDFPPRIVRRIAHV